jgi:hypothetical protein
MATSIPTETQGIAASLPLVSSLQYHADFNVEQTLAANTLVLDGPDAQNWTALLQTFWQILKQPEE